MDDAFELIDPQDAQSFLRRFPVDFRRKGEACFRTGRVLDLVPEESGIHYSGIVEDGEEHEVYLRYDEAEGWGGTCSCPQETARTYARIQSPAPVRKRLNASICSR